MYARRIGSGASRMRVDTSRATGVVISGRSASAVERRSLNWNSSSVVSSPRPRSSTSKRSMIGVCTSSYAQRPKTARICCSISRLRASSCGSQSRTPAGSLTTSARSRRALADVRLADDRDQALAHATVRRNASLDGRAVDVQHERRRARPFRHQQHQESMCSRDVTVTCQPSRRRRRRADAVAVERLHVVDRDVELERRFLAGRRAAALAQAEPPGDDDDRVLDEARSAGRRTASGTRRTRSRRSCPRPSRSASATAPSSSCAEPP